MANPWRQSSVKDDSDDKVVLFLAGTPSTRGISDHGWDTFEHQFLRFFGGLVALACGTGHRCATKLCDYVAAVWVECPNYELPVNYRSWSLPRLLDDTIEQLERNFGFTFVVSFPSEFSASPVKNAIGLNRWRPKTYLAEINVDSSHDVYGPLGGEGGMLEFTDEERTDVRISKLDKIDKRAEAIGSKAEIYPKLRGPHYARKMAREVRKIQRYWDPGLVKDICY